MTIANNTALAAALKAARPGDVVRIDAAFTGAIGLDGLKFEAPGVTVVGPEGGPRPKVAGIELGSCEGLTLAGLDLGLNTRIQAVANVIGCARIDLADLVLAIAPRSTLGGLLFSFSRDVTIRDSIVRDLGTGVRSYMSAGVSVVRNRFRDLSGDAVQSNMSNGVTIDGNDFSDFHTGPGDHPDAIQFFTLRQTSPTTDVVIRNNTVTRGSGDIVQGIFLGDEAGVGFDRVTIDDNAIVGAMFNGIAVGNGRLVSASRNFVQGFADMDSWMFLGGCAGVTLDANRVAIMRLDGSTGVVETGRVSIPSAAVGDYSLMKSWLAAQKPPAAIEPPPAVEEPPCRLRDHLRRPP